MIQKYVLYPTVLLALFMFTKSEAIVINNKTNRNISCTLTGPAPEPTIQQILLEPKSSKTESLTAGEGSYTVSCMDTADDSIEVDGDFDLTDTSSLIIDDTESGRISLEIQ